MRYPRSRLPRSVAAALSLTLALALAGVGCDDEPLQKVQLADNSNITLPPEPTTSLDVNYCTLPTQQKPFRTRFIVIFDRSGSNQPCTAAECGTAIPGTDPDGSRRFGGMQAFVESLTADQQRDFEFALLYFAEDPASDNHPSDPGIPTGQMNRGLIEYGHSFMTSAEFDAVMHEPLALDATGGNAKGERNPYDGSSAVPQDGGWTDYLAVLQQAYNLIYQELNPPQPSLFDPNPPPAQDPGVAFMYVLVFVSDGAPIVSGNLAPAYLQASGPPADYREPWSDPQASNDISREVAQLMSLNQDSGVIGLTVNTVYYSASGIPQDIGTGCPAPSETCTPCLAGDPSCTPTGLLGQMATSGNGQFLNYVNGGSIDFTRITLPSMQVNSNLVAFYANNRNAVWLHGHLVPDSDGDGLADSVETQLGFDPTQVSTAGNGISDWVTSQVCGGPPCDLTQKIASLCVPPNVARNAGGSWADSDGDGLNDCEEALLGSDPQNPDSNGDNLPDGLAAFHSVPFLPGSTPCSALDPDLDGYNDCEETRMNTPVDVPNSTITGLIPYEYTVTNTQVGAQNTCYTIRVDGVSLLTPADQIQFTGVEQPDQLETSVVVRTAQKTAASPELDFAAEDFPQ